MGESLFQQKTETRPAQIAPRDLIAAEVEHLKKNRTTARHGARPARSMSVSVLVLALFVLGGLYILDPLEHAWHRYDAIHAYLYLHAYGAGGEADELAGCGIFRPDEVAQLNRLHDSSKDSFATPTEAAKTAKDVVAYMAGVKQLHAGAYQNLGRINRLRYNLFVRFGLIPPTAWEVLDPSLPEEQTYTLPINADGTGT